MLKSRKKAFAIVAILVFTLLTTSFPQGGGIASAAEVPAGKFKPQTALQQQGAYDKDIYYVFYNGNIYTKMTDPGNKANDDEGKFDKATVMVTLDQEIKYLDDSDATLGLAQWIAAEEAAEGVEIGSALDQGADAIWINLKKETVIPGLHDSHLHFERGGATRYSPDIFWKPLAEIQIIVKNEVAKAAAGARITATGWNQTLDTWNGGKKDFPTKEDLDKVSPNNPVVLTRTDNHANWANSMALRMSPYGGGTVKNGVLVPGPADPKAWPINIQGNLLYADPNGGVIIRDAKGMATGIFIDGAMGTVNEYASYQTNASASASPDRDALSADKYLLSYGITSFSEAGATEESILRYKRLIAEGKMKARAFIAVKNGTSQGDDTQDDVNYRNNQGTAPLIDPKGKLTVSHTKTALDGALGSRGARLKQPYSDAVASGNAPDYVGASERFSDEQVYQIVKRNFDAGWTPTCHSIGDVANEQYINAVSRYLENDKGLTKDSDGFFDRDEVEALGIRPRIEHYQILSTKESILSSAAINLTASMQFVHATSDMSMAGDRVGEARLQYSYAWRKVIKAGMVIANGTDWSVDLLNPYHGLSAGVTRMDRDGKAQKSPRGIGVPWNPITTSISKASDERVTRAEALHYYSYGGAYGQQVEDQLGQLEVGKLADFAVLDRDYFDESVTEDSDIKDINALMTVVGGEICYTMEKPSIVTDQVGNAGVGAPYAFTVTGDMDHSPTLDWSITDRDPALKWLKIDYHSGALSGTPTKAGTFEFDVTAKNYLGSDTVTLSITVNAKPQAGGGKDTETAAADIAGATVTAPKAQVYDGKPKTPAVTVKMGSTVLKAGADYTAAYADNKNVGKATVTIKGIGKYKGQKAVSFNINPKTPSITKVKAGSKSLTVQWKKLAGTTKYQVRYKLNSAKKWITKTVSAKQKSVTVKSLKKGKTYQVQIRSYKTVAKVPYYSSWSKTKTSKKVK
ncbi:MAG: amidohydrolase family protein [Clostridiales Family XIII bacterium]|jgi:predicted amidohydrolase YtcJ|nr:amidohydrolase family protein [Clostridiales Family XIII bacterium]